MTVSLDATGRRLLARFGRLQLTVTVATGGTVLKSFTPKVAQPVKPKHRRHA